MTAWNLVRHLFLPALFTRAGDFHLSVDGGDIHDLGEIAVAVTVVVVIACPCGTGKHGGGKGGDIQFLFAEDILGNNPPPYPRHSKQYREIYKMMEAIQQERIAAFKDYIADVQGGTFPSPEHVIKAPEGLMDAFLDAVEKES